MSRCISCFMYRYSTIERHEFVVKNERENSHVSYIVELFAPSKGSMFSFGQYPLLTLETKQLILLVHV